MREMSMRKAVVFGVCAAFAAVMAFAQEGGEDPAKAGLTPEERRQKILAVTGGMVQSHGSGGDLLVLDLTGGACGPAVAETARLVGEVLKVRVRHEAGKPPKGGDPSAVIRAALAKTNVAAVVAIVSDKSRPHLLVAPEDRWAALNVARVLGAGGGAQVRDARLRKSVWRAVGFMMGAGNSGTPQCPFRPVLAVEELDAGFQLAPAAIAAMGVYARAAGVAQIRQTTYRKACEEGWAPAPTNDFQRAVWDEVKGKNNNN